jgi:hypothetical protein
MPAEAFARDTKGPWVQKKQRNADATIFWHYTSGENVDQILQDELIKPTAVFGVS